MTIEPGGAADGPATTPTAAAGVPPTTRPGRSVARLARHVEQALGDVGLSLPQYRVLAYLVELDGAAASPLAGRLGVTRPSVTALVDGLVGRGLVERRACDVDRRRVEHHLTEAGAAVLADADAAVEARLDRLAEGLDPERAADAHRGLDAWGEALQAALARFLAEDGP